ncbi:hypothetical protein [Methylacidiphilum caldifontis]|uniref:Uncharacterized protein n=1 Tax=Methylacidiphilum caldifontis TaxID=2795386 RepID=A0A4Y8PI70_9BACT|nr:hypothetical protein [Methylacidiphilum caldifontis]TFE71796.1 hypothetical protein A7Q10_04190 [Methylacidiphilum caldifontis]
MKKSLFFLLGFFFITLCYSLASEASTTLKEYKKLGFSKENSHLVPIEEVSKLATVQGELRENLWSYGELSFKAIIAPEVIEATPIHSSLADFEPSSKDQSKKGSQQSKTYVLIVSPKKSLSHLIKKAPKIFSISATTPAKVAAIAQTFDKNFIITLVTIEPPHIP